MINRAAEYVEVGLHIYPYRKLLAYDFQDKKMHQTSKTSNWRLSSVRYIVFHQTPEKNARLIPKKRKP
ncbi:MAG: hypothetical protein EA357_10185 [Micavibrio sp.]|nr:MAG: hypothetical protein EA357_10185 [Micavibrio sp.]